MKDIFHWSFFWSPPLYINSLSLGGCCLQLCRQFRWLFSFLRRQFCPSKPIEKMAMHSTVFFKENEGIAPNSINGARALSELPRWSGLGSQSPPAMEAAAAYGDPFVRSKLTSLELSAGGNQFTVAKDPENQQSLGKGITTHQFTLFSDYDLGNCRSAENGVKTNLTVPSVEAANMEDHGHIKLGFGQPLVFAQYPYAEKLNGVYSTYGAQISGRIMLPLSMASDGVPIFVNAKQYNGIMRRRKLRAKAEMANQVLKSRKPYLHFSRHLHAKRRPRGNGGRFLNTKNVNTINEKNQKKSINDDKVEKQHSQGTESQVSEVLQYSDGLINSKGKNGCIRSSSPGSEVTSHLFTTTHSHHPFQINRLSFQQFPNHHVANITGLGMAMAAGNNYLKV